MLTLSSTERGMKSEELTMRKEFRKENEASAGCSKEKARELVRDILVNDFRQKADRGSSG